MEDLQKFIQKNREFFDDENPSEELWTKIENNLSQDNLDDFIKNNKEAFSDKNPPEKLWDDISSDLDQHVFKVYTSDKKKKQKQVPISYLWRMAAAFIILIIATLWIQFKLINPNESQVGLSETEQKPSLENIDPELLEAELYYEQVINMKKNEVAQYDLVSYGLQDDFKYDIELLDSAYSEIKQEMLEGKSNDMLVNAMINNLQQRMGILNRQLEILRSLQNKDIQNGSRIIQL